MPKNKVQFQRGMSWAEFMARFGTQVQCEAALFAWLQSVEKVTHGYLQFLVSSYLVSS